jgi:hypothetical protein
LEFSGASGIRRIGQWRDIDENYVGKKLSYFASRFAAEAISKVCGFC